MSSQEHYEQMIGLRGEHAPTLSIMGLPYDAIKGTYNLGNGLYCVLDNRLDPKSEIAHLRALRIYVNKRNATDEPPAKEDKQEIEATDES